MKTSFLSPQRRLNRLTGWKSETPSPSPPTSPPISPSAASKPAKSSLSGGSSSWKKIQRVNSPAASSLVSSAGTPERTVILGSRRSMNQVQVPFKSQTPSAWQPMQYTASRARGSLCILADSQTRAVYTKEILKATTYINHKSILATSDAESELLSKAREPHDTYVVVKFANIGETSFLSKVIIIEENGLVSSAVERITKAFDQGKAIDTDSEADSEASLTGDYALFMYENYGKSGKGMRHLKEFVENGISKSTLVCLARQQSFSVKLLDGTVKVVELDIANTVRTAINRISVVLFTGEPLTSDKVDFVFYPRSGADPVPLEKDSTLFVEIATRVFESKEDITTKDFWWFEYQFAIVPSQKEKNDTTTAVSNVCIGGGDSMVGFCVGPSGLHGDGVNSKNGGIGLDASSICAQRLRSMLESFKNPFWKPQGISPYTKTFKKKNLCGLCDEFASVAKSIAVGVPPNAEALCAMTDLFYSLYYIALEVGVCESSASNYCCLSPAYKCLWMTAQAEFISTVETHSKHSAARTKAALTIMKTLVTDSVRLLDPSTLCLCALPFARQYLLSSLCYKLHVILTAVGNILTENSKPDLSKSVLELGKYISFHVTLLAPFLTVSVAVDVLKDAVVPLRESIVKALSIESDEEWAGVVGALCSKAVGTIDDILAVPQMKALPNLDDTQLEVVSVIRNILCSLGHLKSDPSPPAFKRFYKNIRTLFSLLAEVIDSCEEVTITKKSSAFGVVKTFDDETKELLARVQKCAGRLLLHISWLEDSIGEKNYSGNAFRVSTSAIPLLLRELISVSPGLGLLSDNYDDVVLNAPLVNVLVDTVNAEAKALEFILGSEFDDEILFSDLFKEEKNISKTVSETIVALAGDEPIQKLLDRSGRACLNYACVLSYCLAPLCTASIAAPLKRSATDLLLMMPTESLHAPSPDVCAAITPLLSGLETEIVKISVKRDDSETLRDFFYTKTPKDEMRSKKKNDEIMMKSAMISNELEKTLRVVAPALRRICANVSAIGEPTQEPSKISSLAGDTLAAMQNDVLRGIHKIAALLLSGGHERSVRSLEKNRAKLLRGTYCAAEIVCLGYTELRLSAHKELDMCAKTLTSAIVKAVASSKVLVSSKKMKCKEDLELVGAITRLRMAVQYFDGVKLQSTSRLCYLMNEIITVATVAAALLHAVYREQRRRRNPKHKKRPSVSVDRKILELARSTASVVVYVTGTFLDYVTTGARTLEGLHPVCTLLQQYVSQISSTMSETSSNPEKFVADIISAAAALDFSTKSLIILLNELRPPESLDVEDSTATVDDLTKELNKEKSRLEEIQKKRFN